MAECPSQHFFSLCKDGADSCILTSTMGRSKFKVSSYKDKALQRFVSNQGPIAPGSFTTRPRYNLLWYVSIGKVEKYLADIFFVIMDTFLFNFAICAL